MPSRKDASRSTAWAPLRPGPGDMRSKQRAEETGSCKLLGDQHPALPTALRNSLAIQVEALAARPP
jgi:hypothetical protein